MTQERDQQTDPPSEQPQPRLHSAIKTFFDLPNPKILRLLLISSTATLSLGIASTVEWSLHGRHHPGFGWIIYYALFLIFLPALIWVVLLISACSLHRPTQSDSTADEETSMAQHQLAVVRSSDVVTEEAERNTCRSLVVATDERKKSTAERARRLERAVSFPMTSKATDTRRMSKRMSLRLF